MGGVTGGPRAILEAYGRYNQRAHSTTHGCDSNYGLKMWYRCSTVWCIGVVYEWLQSILINPIPGCIWNGHRTVSIGETRMIGGMAGTTFDA